MSSPPVSTSSMTSVATTRYAEHEKQLRSRLLNRLGIYDEGGPTPSTLKQPMTAAQHRRHRILRGMGVGHHIQVSPPDGGSAPRPALNGAVTFSEKLKEDTPRSSPASSPRVSAKKTRIAFQDDVQVLPIPTRYEYSDRIKSRIWSNRHELQENAERNAMEFAAEGWNWRNVTEDEGMYICSVSGELVHPIHLQHIVEEEQQPSDEEEHDEQSQSRPVPLERGTAVHSN